MTAKGVIEWVSTPAYRSGHVPVNTKHGEAERSIEQILFSLLHRISTTILFSPLNRNRNAPITGPVFPQEAIKPVVDNLPPQEQWYH